MQTNQNQEDMKLKQALHKLPEYSPSDDIWLDIVGGIIREDHANAQLQQAIVSLPTYEAPALVWNNIQAQLPATQRQGRVIPMIQRWAAAAALVGAMALVATWWYGSRNADSIAYHNSTEVVNDTFLKQNQELQAEDEMAFAKVTEICEQQAFICEQPQVKRLKSELDELNDARNSLKDAIGGYGTEEDLQQQLLAIEQQRTDILKQIMAEI